jgi:hypothetical protein
MQNILDSLIFKIKNNYLGTNKADSLPKISATVDSNSFQKKFHQYFIRFFKWFFYYCDHFVFEYLYHDKSWYLKRGANTLFLAVPAAPAPGQSTGPGTSQVLIHTD